MRVRPSSVVTAGVVAWLYAPILVMAAFAFNDPGGRFNLTWEGFTLRAWTRLFAIPELAAAIRVSLLLGALTTVIALAIGTPAGLALARRRFRGRTAADSMIVLGIATPEVVMGASMLSLFVSAGAQRGMLTLLISHVTFGLPFVILAVRARASMLDSRLEEAARDLGATRWEAFRTVTLPMLAPGLLAAGALAFVLSIDDVLVSTFVAGHTSTFPLWIWGASRFGVPVQVNVLGTILFIATLAAAAWTLRVSRKPS